MKLMFNPEMNMKTCGRPEGVSGHPPSSSSPPLVLLPLFFFFLPLLSFPSLSPPRPLPPSLTPQSPLCGLLPFSFQLEASKCAVCLINLKLAPRTPPHAPPTDPCHWLNVTSPPVGRRPSHQEDLPPNGDHPSAVSHPRQCATTHVRQRAMMDVKRR